MSTALFGAVSSNRQAALAGISGIGGDCAASSLR